MQPGSLPEDTACTEGQAYSLNDEHIGRDDSLLVEFLSPSSGTRSRCGGIAFNEALSDPARLVLRFRVIRWDLPPGLHQYDHRFWVRQLRDAREASFDTSVAGPYLDSSLIVKRDTVAAPAPDGYDLMLYELYFRHDPSPVPPAGQGAGDAAFQMWAYIDTAKYLTAVIIGGTQPQLSWVNAHPGRPFDRTQIYPRTNLAGAWVLVDSVSPVAEDFADSSLPNGTYEYFVRHLSRAVHG